jgi:hypothetical protein
MFSGLPPSSFAHFEALRLKEPVFTWTNSRLSTDLDLREFAYARPVGDDEAAFLEQGKTFAADRYGGWGVARNGGAARCGNIGPVQVKGICRTPLAGGATPHWHSYGGATLIEVIRDALWGEICHLALPYGGVRAYGIIETGTLLPVRYPRPDGPEKTRRGLLVRQAALRPAHFMRAIDFARADQVAQGLPPDAERCRAAIAEFGTIICAAYGWYGPADADLVNAGLREMLRRFAVQSASAFSRRIMHGAFSPSNLCVDGRWVDFATITSLSDYGRFILARGMPDQFEQHQPVKGMVRDLVYYLRKFSEPQWSSHIISAVDLNAFFDQTYQAVLHFEILKLSGIPSDALQEIPLSLRKQVSEVFMRIIFAGNLEPFKLRHPCPWYVPSMPPQTGHFHFNSLMCAAVTCMNQVELEMVASERLSSGNMANEFVAGFWSLRLAYLRQFPEQDQRHALTFAAVNGVRLNQPLRSLYCTNLDPELMKLIEENGSVDAFISDKLNQCAPYFAKVEKGTFSYRVWDGAEVTWSERHPPTIEGISFQLGRGAMRPHSFLEQEALEALDRLA